MGFGRLGIAMRARFVGDGASDATAEIRGQRGAGLAAHGVAEQLPSLPTACEFGIVLHAAQQEATFVGGQHAVHHRGESFAVSVALRIVR